MTREMLPIGSKITTMAGFPFSPWQRPNVSLFSRIYLCIHRRFYLFDIFLPFKHAWLTFTAVFILCIISPLPNYCFVYNMYWGVCWWICTLLGMWGVKVWYGIWKALFSLIQCIIFKFRKWHTCNYEWYRLFRSYENCRRPGVAILDMQMSKVPIISGYDTPQAPQ